MDPVVEVTEALTHSDVTIIDPDVIIISDEELEEKLSSNENAGPIIISDEEANSSDMYDITTPEVSLTSDDEDSNQPENTSSEVEYVYSFNTNTLKRKPEPESEELNIEQKKKKIEAETEIQNITTVHDMIVQCKKMLPSSSKDTSLVEEVDFSKDVKNEYLQEISSDIDSVKLSINENTSNDITGNSDKELESGEASDGAIEENCFTDFSDLQVLKNTVNCNESKTENDFIDGNDVPKNEMETNDGNKQTNNLNDANNIVINKKDQNNQSNVSKDKSDFIEENNVTKNEKSISNLKRNKYSSKESLFNTTTDPDEKITTDI